MFQQALGGLPYIQRSREREACGMMGKEGETNDGEQD